MKRIKLTLVLFLASLAFLSASDRQIALAYLEKIDQLWEEDRETAFNLIDDAMTYDENLSGLWLFKGLYEEEAQDYRAALVSWEKAFSLDDWESGDFDRFVDSLFPLYSRLGMWESIHEGEERIAFHRSYGKEILIASGWADYFLKNPRAAAIKARKGIDLYPGEWRFYSLMIASGGDDWIPTLLRYFGGDEEIMDLIFHRLYKLNVLPPSLDEWYRANSASLKSYLDLEDRLEGEGDGAGDDLASYLAEEQPADLFLIGRLNSLCGEQGRGMINDYILSAERDFSYDGDGDRIREALFTADHQLNVDRNRDGIWETEIRLDKSGLPSLWRSRGEEELREVSLYEWPSINRVKRERESSVQVFDYLYPRYSLEDYLNFRDFNNFDSPRVLELFDYIQGGDLNISFDSLLTECRYIEEWHGEALARKYYLASGEIMAIEEDPEGEGYFSRQVLLEGGVIQAARRDLNRDGRFDLFEYYENGNWKGYAFNDSWDEKSDFYEDWSFIPLKIWDYDQDSFMDGYMAGPYGEITVTVVPHSDDPRDVGDFISWERKFEAQWYR
ncbi:MAG: hypothetical protein PQJ59_18575 [Spirochaetales bacterium]|nr:hypothetical protein [Spirochaetales bacterium]